MPLTVSNLIALGQTMHEKSVTNFYTLQYFGAPGGPPAPNFTSVGPDYHCAKISSPSGKPVYVNIGPTKNSSLNDMSPHTMRRLKNPCQPVTDIITTHEAHTGDWNLHSSRTNGSSALFIQPQYSPSRRRDFTAVETVVFFSEVSFPACGRWRTVQIGYSLVRFQFDHNAGEI